MNITLQLPISYHPVASSGRVSVRGVAGSQWGGISVADLWHPVADLCGGWQLVRRISVSDLWHPMSDLWGGWQLVGRPFSNVVVDRSTPPLHAFTYGQQSMLYQLNVIRTFIKFTRRLSTYIKSTRRLSTYIKIYKHDVHFAYKQYYHYMSYINQL